MKKKNELLRKIHGLEGDMISLAEHLRVMVETIEDDFFNEDSWKDLCKLHSEDIDLHIIHILKSLANLRGKKFNLNMLDESIMEQFNVFGKPI